MRTMEVHDQMAENGSEFGSVLATPGNEQVLVTYLELQRIIFCRSNSCQAADDLVKKVSGNFSGITVGCQSIGWYPDNRRMDGPR